MTPKNTKKLFQILAEAIPDPTTELRYASHFELLISVILSAQATDISVNKATNLLFDVANTPTEIRKLGIRKLMVEIFFQLFYIINLTKSSKDNIQILQAKCLIK